MILLKTTTAIDQKLLDEGKVEIMIDSGLPEVLAVVEYRSPDPHATYYVHGHVSRYQIALGMEW